MTWICIRKPTWDTRHAFQAERAIVNFGVCSVYQLSKALCDLISQAAGFPPVHIHAWPSNPVISGASESIHVPPPPTVNFLRFPC